MDGGFVDELIVGKLTDPTDLAIAQDGTMFVAERHGVVWIVRNRVRLRQPFLVLDDVEVGGESGLLGLAVHPSYPEVPYVYLLYTVNRRLKYANEPTPVPTFGRLVRYTAQGDEVLRDSQTILFGKGPEDGIPNCSTFHSVGAVKVGSDGFIYLSAGDGASYEGIDIGDPDDRCSRLFGRDQGTGARRSQQINSL